jgi:cytochrome P450
MTTSQLDRERLRELFDLRRRAANTGGRYSVYEDDPYPAFHRLREQGPVVEGIPHELIGYEGFAFFHGIPDPSPHHFSVFSYAECDTVYRNEEIFRSAPAETNFEGSTLAASMLYMNGAPHRRYRTLVQPSFVPAKAKWWMENWIHQTVNGLIDGFEGDKRAELNVDFDAAIPMLTITGSFGLDVEQALEVRASLEGMSGGRALDEFLMPIIQARRSEPQDDLVSVLCQAEVQDDDGSTHRLSDDEIMAFSSLLLAAGSGTTWKQMGITLIALLSMPGAIDAIRADSSLLRQAVEESLRWNATDLVFSRWVAEDTELAGVELPKGAVVHVVLGAGNCDPERWENPDVYDVHRPMKPHLGFAGGPHICLGMHVARAELTTAIGALIERLPNLRLDPDAEQPKIIGMYERGPSEINVIWD